MPQDRASPAADDTIGVYRLIEPLDPRGGTFLWRAEGPRGRVHIELFSPRLRWTAALDAVVERRRAAPHPNLVPILDAGMGPTGPFVVTAAVSGLRLPALLEGLHRSGRAMPAWTVAHVVRGVAQALAHLAASEPAAESVGRAIHPAGVGLTVAGQATLSTVTAFDLSDHGLDDDGIVAAYRSPEMVEGRAVDPRSDLFALGVIAWELLSDKPLFGRMDGDARTEAIRRADVPALPDTAPEQLVAIIVRCLAREPEDRLASAEALVDQLDQALQRRPEASTDEARHLVSLAGSFLAPVADATTVEPRSEHPVGASGGNASADPFFDALRDTDGITSDRFRVLGTLGIGGMSSVYKVYDSELDEVVALKMLPRTGPVEPKSLERLRREVRLARRIASDYVCRIHDLVDVGDGARGITMEVIEGATLADMMKAGLHRNDRQIARWGADIAAGLAAAHQLGIVHRDLKPENVIIRDHDRQAIILDFGIARTTAEEDAESRLTQQGIIMGTPRYMSPEQLANGPLDGRSDLYALGLLLAEMITGEVPRGGTKYEELVEKRTLNPQPYDIQTVAPDIAPELADAINGLLMSAADDRPPAARAVYTVLLRCSTAHEDEVDETESGEAAAAAAPWSRRAISAAAVVLIGAAAILAFTVYERSRPSPVPEPPVPAAAPPEAPPEQSRPPVPPPVAPETAPARNPAEKKPAPARPKRRRRLPDPIEM